MAAGLRSGRVAECVMSNEVLILGNGISRLLHDDYIESFNGEVWGCNYVYVEYPHKLTRVAGHIDVMQEALEYRDRHGWSYDIWTGNFGRFSDSRQKFTCRREFWKNSGTTLVAQALHEDWEKIWLCGYDMGGRDIYTVRAWRQNKNVWVRRWRELHDAYGTERIRFVGFDHKPYLLDKSRGEREYVYNYKSGRPHIDDPAYVRLFEAMYGVKSEPRRTHKVRVRYIKGKIAGWETHYKEPVARILAEKGEVELIDEIDAGERSDEDAAEDVRITSRIKLAALQKIAERQNVEGWEDMTRTELLAVMRDKANN